MSKPVDDPRERIFRSALEDIIAAYEWCSVDPVDRGYSSLDNEVIRAKRLLSKDADAKRDACRDPLRNNPVVGFMSEAQAQRILDEMRENGE